MKILILGGTGLVGSFIRNSSLADEFRLIIHGHENKSDVNCDMTNINEMYNLLSKDKYEIILNLVAQTDVDKCEQDASASFNYNIKTAYNLSQTIKILKINSRLIHISTDQIYNENGRNKEEDQNPINNYSLSKYLAEKLFDLDKTIILRTNFFGKSTELKLESFSDWIFKKSFSQDKVLGFDDIVFNPVSNHTFIKTLRELVVSKEVGVFNLGSAGQITKFGFIKKFLKAINRGDKIQLHKANSSEYLFAQRPQNMVMCNKKISKLLPFKLPSIEEEIFNVGKDYCYNE